MGRVSRVGIKYLFVIQMPRKDTGTSFCSAVKQDTGILTRPFLVRDLLKTFLVSCQSFQITQKIQITQLQLLFFFIEIHTLCGCR